VNGKFFFVDFSLGENGNLFFTSAAVLFARDHSRALLSLGFPRGFPYFFIPPHPPLGPLPHPCFDLFSLSPARTDSSENYPAFSCLPPLCFPMSLCPLSRAVISIPFLILNEFDSLCPFLFARLKTYPSILAGVYASFSCRSDAATPSMPALLYGRLFFFRSPTSLLV